MNETDVIAYVQGINNNQAVIEFNLDGTILSANELFLETEGYSAKEMDQKHGVVILKLMSIDEVTAEKLQSANRSGIMNLQACSDGWSYTSIGAQEQKRMCPIFDLSWLAKSLL